MKRHSKQKRHRRARRTQYDGLPVAAILVPLGLLAAAGAGYYFYKKHLAQQTPAEALEETKANAVTGGLVGDPKMDAQLALLQRLSAAYKADDQNAYSAAMVELGRLLGVSADAAAAKFKLPLTIPELKANTSQDYNSADVGIEDPAVTAAKAAAAEQDRVNQLAYDVLPLQLKNVTLPPSPSDWHVAAPPPVRGPPKLATPPAPIQSAIFAPPIFVSGGATLVNKPAPGGRSTISFMGWHR